MSKLRKALAEVLSKDLKKLENKKINKQIEKRKERYSMRKMASKINKDKAIGCIIDILGKEYNDISNEDIKNIKLEDIENNTEINELYSDTYFKNGATITVNNPDCQFSIVKPGSRVEELDQNDLTDEQKKLFSSKGITWVENEYPGYIFPLPVKVKLTSDAYDVSHFEGYNCTYDLLPGYNGIFEIWGFEENDTLEEFIKGFNVNGITAQSFLDEVKTATLK